MTIFSNRFFFFVNSPVYLALQVLSGQKFEFLAQNFHAANTVLKIVNFYQSQMQGGQKIRIFALNLHSDKFLTFA